MFLLIFKNGYDECTYRLFKDEQAVQRAVDDLLFEQTRDFSNDELSRLEVYSHYSGTLEEFNDISSNYSKGCNIRVQRIELEEQS